MRACSRPTLQRNVGPLAVDTLTEAHALIESARSYGKLVLTRIS